MTRTLFAVTFAMIASSAQAQSAPLPYKSSHQSVGVVSCGSTLCHGSIRTVPDSNVLQSEYVTWTRLDKHARAYSILFSAQSKKIAKNLGIKSAHEERLCVDCHAHAPPPALRGERFRVDDGVSCEGCHGPAQRWLPAHVERGATHSRNIEHGLFPTDDAVQRAQLCLSCHLGNRDRLVTHRLMGAGHPRMSFELDTFTVVEPAHFKVDSDYAKRKRLWDGVQVWAIGQAIAVSQTLELLTDPKIGRDGFFPELVFFDCHACHRSMKSGRWAPRADGVNLGPGVPRLNDANLLMVRQIAKVVAPDLAGRITAATEQLHLAVSQKSGDPMQAAGELRQLMSALIARLAQRSFNAADLRAIVQGLLDDGRAGAYRDYSGAEQATLAIGSLTNFMFQRGILKSAAPANRALARLQAAVADDENFKPEQFQAALKQVDEVLASPVARP